MNLLDDIATVDYLNYTIYDANYENPKDEQYFW